jgi:hypothetical protein
MVEPLSLPNQFFSDKTSECGLLWLPPLVESRFTQRVDWLSGLSLSYAYRNELKTWSKGLEKIIEKEDLDLDKMPSFDSSTLIFKLPPGFKASMGLVVKNCTWDSPDHVFTVYSKHSKDLNPDFIQSPYIWPSKPSQLLKEVQWINL